VFDYGVVPWEYRWGIRSWLFPMLLAAPMALGEALAPDGTLYRTLPALAMIAASLVVPWSGWRLGRGQSLAHAAIAALVGATWSEFVYFAPHSLSENASIACALPAAALLVGRRHRRDVFAAGLLLGVATLLRFQLAPALAVLAMFGCARDPARWRGLIAGGLVAAAIGSLVDLAHGAVPFAWLVENLRQNLLDGRAAQYGTSGPFGYVTWFEHVWGWWLLAIVPLVRIGMRRVPALGWAGIVNLLVHSLIAHKEYRFVEFSAVAFVLVAAIGSVDVAAWLGARLRASRAALALAAVGWLAASAAVATTPAMRDNWTRAADKLAITAMLRDDPALCGVALLTDLGEWGGYSDLHRRVPIGYFDRNDPLLRGTALATALRRESGGYNRIVATPADAARLPAGYRARACVGGTVCLFARAGGCRADPASPFAIQTVMVRIDRQMRENQRRGLRPLS